MTCKVELINKKDPLVQLKASKSSIGDQFNDLLDETKGFKYQILLKILLENKLAYPVHISDQTFENSMDLLLIFNETKSHYVQIKDFGRFRFHKTKN